MAFTTNTNNGQQHETVIVKGPAATTSLEPLSRTYQYRKVMKPMLERKRRARINRCLDELKELMVTALQSEGENVSKLEKADILELTVRHLHKLKRHQRLSSSPIIDSDRFRAGFKHAANEVSVCLSNTRGVDINLGRTLMTHLAHRLNDLDKIQPLTVQVGGGQQQQQQQQQQQPQQDNIYQQSITTATGTTMLTSPMVSPSASSSLSGSPSTSPSICCGDNHQYSMPLTPSSGYSSSTSYHSSGTPSPKLLQQMVYNNTNYQQQTQGLLLKVVQPSPPPPSASPISTNSHNNPYYYHNKEPVWRPW